jgi:predicted O-methyltransferase YrrM
VTFDWEEIERYAAELTTPSPELFERLAEETRATQSLPQMMVGPVEAEFLRFMVFMQKPSLVLELGTFTGWSSIAMASALPQRGKVITCDVNPDTTAIARRYAEEAGVADRIQYLLGPALDTVDDLDGPFDFVFIDADKPAYVEYYEALLPKLADGGVILADNTLFGVWEDETGKAVDRFNRHVRDDDRVEQVLLTIREGVTLIRRARA